MSPHPHTNLGKVEASNSFFYGFIFSRQIHFKIVFRERLWVGFPVRLHNTVMYGYRCFVRIKYV